MRTVSPRTHRRSSKKTRGHLRTTSTAFATLSPPLRNGLDRITNLRDLLNLKDLAQKAEECDRKALLAKRAELRNTFMDLAEQYRVLALKVKASQKEHASSAKPLVEKIVAQRLAERLSLFGGVHPPSMARLPGLKKADDHPADPRNVTSVLLPAPEPHQLTVAAGAEPMDACWIVHRNVE